MKTVRIAVINSHPIQYFAPLYAFVNRDADFDVTMLYLSDLSLRGAVDPGFGQAVTWNIDLLAGYRSVFLGERAKTREPGGFFSLIAPQVWSEIRSGRYDALLIHGHNYAANLIAVVAAKSIGLPVLIRGDTHLGLIRTGLRRLLRGPVMRMIYANIDHFLAIGSANAAFYRAMGVPSRKIIIAPCSVDNDRFTAESSLTDQQKLEWRTKFAIPLGMPAILYAAKFSQRKHPEMVLEAAQAVRSTRDQPFAIVMCGAGEMEPELRKYCSKHGLDNVVFTGFVNQAELPKLYGVSDIFALPSENEPWALAVNEAMCAGLPVVVSREVGCVQDLVRDGVNGSSPEANDLAAWSGALSRLLADESLRKAQGEASRRIISQWSYREVCEALRTALVGTGRGERPPGETLA